MAKTVFANKREVAHRGNQGRCVASPNVCYVKCPAPPGQVPVPFVALGKTEDVSDGPVTVKVEGAMPLVEGGKLAQSGGADPAKPGGIMSGTNTGPGELTTFSPNVKFEGRGVGRLGDSLWLNGKNAM